MTILGSAIESIRNSGAEVFAIYTRDEILKRCGEPEDATIYLDHGHMGGGGPDTFATEKNLARRDRLISLLIKNCVIRKSRRHPGRYRVLRLF